MDEDEASSAWQRSPDRGGARKQREVIFPMLTTDTAEDLRGQGAKKLEVHGQRNVQPKGRREGMMYLKG